MKPVARQIYRLAQRFDGDNVDVLTHLANTYIKAGLHHPINPGSPPGSVDSAALDQAETILRRAIQLDPTNVFALFNTCVLRRAQNRIPEAMEMCRRALEVDPRYPGALRELGHDLMRSGDAAQAIVSYRASIDAAPYQAYAFDSFKGLAAASLAPGRGEDAIVYLRKSVEADVLKDDNESLWLAAALEMNGRHAEAAASLKDFMDRHSTLEVNEDYFQLLSAPVYSDCREQVLAALIRAGYRQQ
jgi:tetratricopeptide (TPR) repeat protein